MVTAGSAIADIGISDKPAAELTGAFLFPGAGRCYQQTAPVMIVVIAVKMQIRYRQETEEYLNTHQHGQDPVDLFLHFKPSFPVFKAVIL